MASEVLYSILQKATGIYSQTIIFYLEEILRDYNFNLKTFLRYFSFYTPKF